MAISIISHLGAESIKDESAYIDKRSQTLAEAVFWIQPGTEKRNVIRLFGVPDFKAVSYTNLTLPTICSV